MTGVVASGGPAWPRWLPWVGLRSRRLDADDCARLARENASAVEPGTYRELAFVWLGHDFSAFVVEPGQGRETLP